MEEKLWERETILQGKQFESVKLSDDEKLSNGEINLRVFLEDYYFVINSFMMKPFPQQGLTSEKRVGNYRYRRPRRISENLFAFKVTDGEYF